MLLSTSVVNGRIYAIGGRTYPQNDIIVSTVEEYDPATDTWTQKAEIPTPRFWLSTSAVNGRVYAIGGCVNPHSVSFSTVEAYDPAMDTWAEKADMPTPRKGLATSVVNGKIYAIGGSAVPHWFACVSTVEQYEPGLPPPDFNGDWKIDIEDLIILIEHWGTDEPLCDIAPPPSGDGIVDVQDLEVLMSYWGQEFEFLPFDLLAYWKLDETEGSFAADSAGNNEGTLNGEPLWQPTAGRIDGALAVDGTDDYVSTPFVLDPADGPFSVFAWIKGGAPGQVILSQADSPTGRGVKPGSTWLGTDPSEGKFMSSFTSLTHAVLPLVSESVITDGNWHHVGFVWDGSDRILYVDEVEVARDTQVGLEGSAGDLYIGAGTNLEPGSFFSGLIDDVRIYNRAVIP